MRTVLAFSAACLAAATVSAATGPDVDIATRAKGAQKVVVATVVDVQSNFETNDYGDRLIMSHATLEVDETMKGSHAQSVDVTVEGGTVGDLTLSVSDMPMMVRGERAVLFLDQANRGGHVPHGRGLGILKLDATDHITGTNISLDDVRKMVAAAQGKE